MEKQHLTYFKIENFKRFDSFEMSNLGQFNLIVGDNNVGKTSVLEALMFDSDAITFIANYLHTFLNRDYSFSNFGNLDHLNINISIPNFWQTISKDNTKPILFYVSQDLPLITAHFLHASSLDEEEKEEIGKTVISVAPEHWLKIAKNGLAGSGSVIPEYWLKMNFPSSGSFQLIPIFFENKFYIYQQNTPFISANLGYYDDLVTYFYKYFNEFKSTRKELENNLKLVVPNIEEIRVHRFYEDRDMIAFSTKGDDNLKPITQFGDGTVKLIRLLMEIIINHNKRLMVDEIGAGIHFTRLKDYWKTIIQLCSKYNVQLFATTHSLECQRAFVDALDDAETKPFQSEARNITLLENKQGEVKAVTYTFDEFEFSLANDINTRGGKL